MKARKLQPAPGSPREPRALSDPAALLDRLAHDLRSPLGVLASVIVQLSADQDLSSDARTLVCLGSRGAERLRLQVDRLALLSMLSARRVPPEAARQVLNLGALAEQAVSLVRESAPRREVEVLFDRLSPAESVLGDRRCLTHLIRELVHNGVSHAVRATRIVLGRADGAATLSVEDDGAGARDAVRTAITGDPLPPSHGIGLSLALDLAEISGGRIVYGDSTLPPGRPGTVGARFTLLLPLAASP